MGITVNASPVWRFGVFEIEAYSGELRRNGVVVRLREQPTRILIFLLDHAGRMVTRDQLRQHLWPANTFVDFDHSLNTAVMKLREALGDPADKPVYIQTIPKKGYRFIAPVTRLAEHPADPPPHASPAGIAPINMLQLQSNQAAAAEAATVMAEAAISAKEAEPAAWRRPGGGWELLSRKTALLLLLIVASVGAGTWIRPHAPSIRHPLRWSVVSVNQRLTPLTTVSGNARSPAFSPDGRQIAFLWDGEDGRRDDVYVQLVGDTTPLRLTRNRSGFLGNPQWSPDGRHIAFTRCDGKQDGVYVVEALGGQERRLTSAACIWGEAGRPIWTRDGTSMLLIDWCGSPVAHGVVLLSLATGKKRCLTAPKNADDVAESLSPDEKTIAFTRMTSGEVREVYTVGLSGGVPQRLTFEHSDIYDLMWTPDGRSITFISNRGMLPRPWRVAARGGPMKPETIYPGVGSFTRDGARFAYADSVGKAPAIWRADLTGPGGRITSRNRIISSQYRDDEAQPTPDGSRIALESERTGSNEIWLNSADGRNPVQLTSLGRFSGSPHWSLDGRWIAFDCHPKDYGQIYVIDAEGRNLHAVTSGAYENVMPSWSRDGKSIYFASRRTGEWQMWEHALETGMEKQLTRHGGFAGSASPDGKTIYYSKFGEAGVWSMPAAGGEETLVLEGKPQVGYWGHLAVTDAGLYFLDAEADPRPMIDFYSFASRRVDSVLPLEKYPSAWQPSLSASADGRSIFYTQSDPQSAILMIENVH